MVLFSANNLKKMFLDEVLFDGVSFNIAEGDKIGFIGVNGAGKSTLFKIMNGMLEYDSGEIYPNKFLKIGYLEQHTCIESEKTIMEEMLGAFSNVISIENELEDIRVQIEKGGNDVDALVKRQSYLQEQFEKLDGYQYRGRIKSALIGLGFGENEFYRSVNELSGGQKTRIALGRLLLSDSNLLLLDEPTNHLDIESVEWHEGILQTYSGSFIIISHDRYFLDKVTNRTFEMNSGRLKTYTGNYTLSLAQRELENKTIERNYENTVKEIERLEGIVQQQRRWNREKNIKTAESKQKVIDKLSQSLVKPLEMQEDIEFSFQALGGGGQDVLITEKLGMSFGEKQIFCGCDTHIVKGERVFLLGPNGCGKTTFIKNIMGEYEPTEGYVKIGTGIEIGYYDQIQQNLNPENTVFDEIHNEYPMMTQTQIRNALAVFLFKGEDVFKEIKKLSGGERARVELVKLMLRPVNFLIMDEPTNHLDIESREALEKALEAYDGTVLMVSHDRYFINKLSDRIIYMSENGFENYIGSYDNFMEKKTSRTQTVYEKTEEKPKNTDYQEQKKQQAEKRKLLNRFKKVEELIEQLETEINEINEEMTKPEYSLDFTKLSQLSQQAQDKETELENLMEEWEELQLKAEEMGYSQ